MSTTATSNEQSEPIGRATYSSEDNKLRLYADARLDADTYARVKAAGFGWAPKQGLFVAPMWTPQRYDLLVELCGEVGDEDSTLQERAEQRAERFTRYKANRHRDAHSAADRVAQLTEHVPMGQPILIGHHSQDKAERQAKKITRAMETAVDQWSRHEYWTARIPAVIRHAEWKADAALRHRRIKGIEADLRKVNKEIEQADFWANRWAAQDLTCALAWRMADCDRSGAYDILRAGGAHEHGAEVPPEVMEAARAKGIAKHERNAAWSQRWADHYALRLAYERELMAQSGGDMRERFDFAIGGKVQGGRWSTPGAWHTIVRVNKSAGKINSLTVKNAEGTRSWQGSQSIIPVEQVTAYEPPTEGEEAPKAVRRKPLPLCNYPSTDALSMTEAEYKAIPERHREIRNYYNDQEAQWKQKATHRRYHAWIEGADGHGWGGANKYVYLSDKKTTLPPVKDAPPPPPTDHDPLPERLRFELTDADVAETPAPRVRQEAAAPTLFDQMRETLKGGVQIAVAHQLYPTPKDIGRRMCELAGSAIYGARILEPSAGTGELIKAAQDYATGADNVRITAVEINHGLVQQLEQRRNLTVGATPETCRIVHADFLEADPDELGQFGVVLMNPPFENASDIKHIQHALKFLKPGGVLVGICADGPRQNAWLEERATHIEKLPAGTFAGTQVRTALFTIDA